jgi:hypothetical protein
VLLICDSKIMLCALIEGQRNKVSGLLMLGYGKPSDLYKPIECSL